MQESKVTKIKGSRQSSLIWDFFTARRPVIAGFYCDATMFSEVTELVYVYFNSLLYTLTLTPCEVKAYWVLPLCATTATSIILDSSSLVNKLHKKTAVCLKQLHKHFFSYNYSYSVIWPIFVRDGIYNSVADYNSTWRVSSVCVCVSVCLSVRPRANFATG